MCFHRFQPEAGACWPHGGYKVKKINNVFLSCREPGRTTSLLIDLINTQLLHVYERDWQTIDDLIAHPKDTKKKKKNNAFHIGSKSSERRSGIRNLQSKQNSRKRKTMIS